MKVLFLSTHLNAGGITSYLYTLTKGMIKRGHEVFVASSGGEREDDFSQLGAKVIVIPIKTKSELSPKIYLAQKPLKEQIRKNDINIIHAHTRITQVMGQMLKKKTRTPFVSTCHGFFKKRLSRRMFPCWGDRTIAISEAVEEHLKNDFRVNKDRITLINSGVDIERFPLIDEQLRKESRAKFHLNQEPVVGHIGRLSDVKGQDVLIKSIRKVIGEIPQARLLMFGEGKEEDALKNLVNELNLKDHVMFYPLVNRTSDCLSVMDVFVMPSRQEGLGLSVMEAQASGLPVVASNIGGIPSLIEDGKTGLLVNPENVDELAGAIIKALTDKSLAQSLGSAAREYIKDNFTEDRMVEQTLQVYEELLS